MIRLGARAVCVGRRGARVLLQGAAGGCSCVRTPQAAARVMKRRSHCSDDDWGVPRCMHSARMKGPLRCVELGGRACCGSPEHRARGRACMGKRHLSSRARAAAAAQASRGKAPDGSPSARQQVCQCNPAFRGAGCQCWHARTACTTRRSIGARRPACQRANAEQASEQLQAPARHLPARQKLVFFFPSSASPPASSESLEKSIRVAASLATSASLRKSTSVACRSACLSAALSLT